MKNESKSRPFDYILPVDEFEALDQDEAGASDPDVVLAYSTLHARYTALREALVEIANTSPRDHTPEPDPDRKMTPHHCEDLVLNGYIGAFHKTRDTAKAALG